jgi:pimeloyl-ACP methyl ester carboxylesterase
MVRRLVPAVALCAVALAALGSGAGAAGPSRSQICTDEQLKCFFVTVPIDRTGTVPGHIKLWVQEYVPRGHSRGVMFLLAGGPGQPSTSEFDLNEFGFWAHTMPGYTLVDFDPRGTGASDPLVCHESSAAGCAAEIGPKRQFYRTVDNAMDLDAVREALGAPKIAIYGASYGTDVATIYARMYPSRVTRLLLDSVAQPFNSLSLVAGIVRQIPSTLRRFCDHVCTGATRSYATDAVALAHQVAARPLRGIVLRPSGRYVHVKLHLVDLLNLVIASDLYDGIGAELPAAVAAAKGGDARPLLRLEEAVNPTPTFAPAAGDAGFNAVYLTTLCDDGPFPWQPDTPIPQRGALDKAAIASLPAGAFGAIGPAAAEFSTAPFCLHWPVSTVATTVPATYPNIPVLAVSGNLDLRSPTFESRQLLTHFPRGHLLTVPNAGHAPLADRESPCLAEAVRRWLAGASVTSRCPVPRRLAPIAPLPVAGSPATPAETLAAVTSTLREAEASWALTRSDIAGIAGGRLTVTRSGFALSGYDLAARGIDLDGGIDSVYQTNERWIFGGALHVIQHGSTIGELALQLDGTLDGTLDGKTVTESRLSSPAPPTPAKAPPANWSSWAPAPGSTAHVAAEIAAHVGAGYLLHANGPSLVKVHSTAAGAYYFAVALRQGFGSESPSDTHFSLTGSTWAYSMCGAGSYCSISGEPTALRGQLVRREGLELALYTFQFDPSIDSVVVVLPPPVTEGFSALYFTRSELARQLHEPLAHTLPLTTPPLPTNEDSAEAGTINGVTLKRLYSVHVHDDGPAGHELVLHSEF